MFVELLTTQVKIQEEAEEEERQAELDKEKTARYALYNRRTNAGKFKLDEKGLMEGLDIGDLS